MRVALVLAALAALFASAAEARLAPSLEADVVAAPPPERQAAAPVWPPGRERPLLVVRGGDTRTGSGPVMRYLVEVEAGIVISRLEFARKVHAIVGDPMSWGGTGRVSFRRVSRGPADFRVTLARPGRPTDSAPRTSPTGSTRARTAAAPSSTSCAGGRARARTATSGATAATS